MWFSPYLCIGEGGKGLGHNLRMQFYSFGSSEMVVPLLSLRRLAEGTRICSEDFSSALPLSVLLPGFACQIPSFHTMGLFCVSIYVHLWIGTMQRMHMSFFGSVCLLPVFCLSAENCAVYD